MLLSLRDGAPRNRWSTSPVFNSRFPVAGQNLSLAFPELAKVGPWRRQERSGHDTAWMPSRVLVCPEVVPQVDVACTHNMSLFEAIRPSPGWCRWGSEGPWKAFSVVPSPALRSAGKPC
jgi:hypothetical protein